jgi:2-methylisocitrate lyase-like PEP mutase family enzyme
MYAVVTFTDHTGASHSEKLGAHDGSRFTVNQVVVADARQLVTVTVYNADGSVYGTCTDSVESYVARARDAQANGLALYEAIIKFADSAYTYLHNR